MTTKRSVWELPIVGLLAFAAATGANVAPPAFGYGSVDFPGEASWDESLLASAPDRPQTWVTGPSARVALNAARLRPGQQLAIGFNVQSTLGVPADLLLGVLLPDGRTLFLFSSAGGVTFSGPVASLSALPAEIVPANFSLDNPGFLQVTLPAEGVPTGTFLVFALLLQRGALANDQLDAGDVLASDLKTFTVSTGPPSGAVPFLQSPFTSQYRIANFFDHAFPQEFSASNGVVVPYWGEQVASATDINHQGYDFSLPEGTPLIAAADGSVIAAGLTAPFFCPPLNSTVQNMQVVIDHLAPDGVHYRSSYQHLSRIDVQVGQRLVAGQGIGLSGNTGCSTGPHLHYEVFRVDPGTGQRITTDPYGWEGLSADPWAIHPQGGPSVWLWQEGREPAVFREVVLAPNPSGSTAAVTLTIFRWMGVNDAQNPNNEFVEIALDPRFVTTPTFDLTGFILRNNRGDAFPLPPGFLIRVGRPVRVYTGPGVRTDTTLFWGLGAGVWDNATDCARLVYPNGSSYRLSNTAGACS